jgi:hypothetical protein
MKILNKLNGGSIAAVAVFALSAYTTQANLLINPGFDNAGQFTANPITPAGVNQGWATFGATGQNDMFSSPVDSPLSGGFALLEVNNPGNNWNPAGAYQILTVSPGLTYNYSIWAITDTGSTWGPTPVDLQLSFGDGSLDSNGNPATTSTPTGISPNNGSFSFGTSVANNANQWVQYSVTATAPANTQYAIVYAMFMDNGQTAAENMYFDNASLVVVPEPATAALLGLAASFYFIRRRKV